jgi:CheY-like chemotaxis protein
MGYRTIVIAQCCGGGEEKTQIVEQGMTYSILVVEDEDDVRDLVATSLRHRGFSVLSVPNAEVALQILSEQVKFDLLFTDIVMPGLIDGFELADRAKRLQPNLKVLYATGFAHVSRRPVEKLHGKLIQKPYRAEELASEVRQTLEGAA